MTRVFLNKISFWKDVVRGILRSAGAPDLCSDSTWDAALMTRGQHFMRTSCRVKYKLELSSFIHWIWTKFSCLTFANRKSSMSWTSSKFDISDHQFAVLIILSLSLHTIILSNDGIKISNCLLWKLLPALFINRYHQPARKQGDLLRLGYFLLGNVRSRLSDVHFDAAQPGGQRLYLFADGRSLAGWKWDEKWDEMWVPKLDDRGYHGTTH